MASKKEKFEEWKKVKTISCGVDLKKWWNH